MSNIRKIIACLITVMICNLLTLDVSASELSEEVKNKMSNVLESVEFEKENYGLDGVEFENIEIGGRISAYEIVDGKLKELSFAIYPVMFKEKMVSQFFVLDEGGEVYVQLDNSLVEKTNEIIQLESLCYLYDKNGVYVFSDSKIENVAMLTIDQKETVQSNRGEVESVENTLFAKTLCSNPFEMTTKLKICHEEKTAILSSTTPTSAYCGVDIIKQPSGTSYCWAITLTSIANYIFDGNWTYSDVLQMCTNGADTGQTISEAIADFNQHFGAGYVVAGSANPTPEFIIDVLDAGYPMYGSFIASGGHAVVIRGCNRVAQTFSVMNPTPTTTSYTSGTISSGNIWKFVSVYGGSTYTLRNYAYRYNY